jgi:hypothetical protein
MHSPVCWPWDPPVVGQAIGQPRKHKPCIPNFTKCLYTVIYPTNKAFSSSPLPAIDGYPLIEETSSYHLVYNWFEYLHKHNHSIAGYVIMPNHVHALIDFAESAKKINTIIGNGKRFIAYELIERLKKSLQNPNIKSIRESRKSQRKRKGQII